MSRHPEIEKLYFYDTIADRYDRVMNRYDLNRRVEIVFDRLLTGEDLAGRLVLDVGCGTGWFSRRAGQAGARVVSTDIGVAMLKQTRAKCDSALVAADASALGFASGCFDVVISSECIEHTLDPFGAVREMHRVLRPRGALVVTVPNKLWRFSAAVADILKLRPYEGLENWVGWRELKRELRSLKMAVVTMVGFHLFPPVVQVTWPFLKFMDRFGGSIGPVMLNIAVKARKT